MSSSSEKFTQLLSSRQTSNLEEIFEEFPIDMEWRRQCLRQCVETGDQDFINAVFQSGDWVVFAMTSDIERLAKEQNLVI